MQNYLCILHSIYAMLKNIKHREIILDGQRSPKLQQTPLCEILRSIKKKYLHQRKYRWKKYKLHTNCHRITWQFYADGSACFNCFYRQVKNIYPFFNIGEFYGEQVRGTSVSCQTIFQPILPLLPIR